MKLKLTEIKLNPNNPRVIKDEKFKKLVTSIKDFPEMLKLRPLVIDEDNVLLGGNMRYRALLEAGIKEVEVTVAKGLTEDQKREFIIKDNVSYGEWDIDILANEWDLMSLDNWGLDVTALAGMDMDADKLGEEFELPDGDKSPFQQMTFTLADEQATQLKNALEDLKKTEEYKYCETFGNENSNGNALYLLVMQWVGQRK